VGDAQKQSHKVDTVVGRMRALDDRCRSWQNRVDALKAAVSGLARVDGKVSHCVLGEVNTTSIQTKIIYDRYWLLDLLSLIL
jgi:hypothetical protein